MITQIFIAIFTRLYETQYDITKEDFQEIFDEGAAHLWRKFTYEWDFNLLDFFNHLDVENKAKMCQYIVRATDNDKAKPTYARLRNNYQVVIGHVAAEIEAIQTKLSMSNIAEVAPNEALINKIRLKRLQRLHSILSERKNKLI